MGNRPAAADTGRCPRRPPWLTMTRAPLDLPAEAARRSTHDVHRRTFRSAAPPTCGLPGLKIAKLAVGPFDNNAYLRCTETGDGVLIDAAAEPDRLLALMADQPISDIITTHQHGDHWQALEQVAG